jgi:hypothetical protein
MQAAGKWPYYINTKKVTLRANGHNCKESMAMIQQCLWSATEPNIFLRICTHTHTITISSDLCPSMPTHSMTCAHPCPCPPMLFKLCPCIQKLCNVYYPPTPSLGWIGQIKGRSLSMAFVWRASWLVHSLHPRSSTLIWS